MLPLTVSYALEAEDVADSFVWSARHGAAVRGSGVSTVAILALAASLVAVPLAAGDRTPPAWGAVVLGLFIGGMWLGAMAYRLPVFRRVAARRAMARRPERYLVSWTHVLGEDGIRSMSPSIAEPIETPWDVLAGFAETPVAFVLHDASGAVRVSFPRRAVDDVDGVRALLRLRLSPQRGGIEVIIDDEPSPY